MRIGRRLRDLHIPIPAARSPIDTGIRQRIILPRGIGYLVGRGSSAYLALRDCKRKIFLHDIVNRDAVDIALPIRLRHVDLGNMIGLPVSPYPGDSRIDQGIRYRIQYRRSTVTLDTLI